MEPNTAASWLALALALAVAMWPIILVIGVRIGRVDRETKRRRKARRAEPAYPMGSPYRPKTVDSDG